ncbi:MAG: zinc ribbon domain-containing protein [Oscillospiraceae bacterium]|nr:zinc ribbon domain-containing protein [Oscillospiraceae bacterium]
MALINCPECGNQMSDKAAACPHCGASAVPAVQTKTCTECGGILRPEDKVCPMCGCPAESAQSEPEQPIQQPIPAQPVMPQYAQQPVLNNTAVMKKSRKKLWIPIVIVLAVLCIAAGVVFVLLNNSVKQVTDEPYMLTVGDQYYEGTYSGGWRNDKPNGAGIFKRKYERRDFYTTYEGEWEDGSLKRGKISYYNGDVYEGEFRDWVLNGEGIKTLSDGNIYEGEFENNRLNGQGRITYADGSVLTGEFADGEIVNGTGRMPFGYDNEYFYEGEWHDSKFTGYARRSFWSREGTVYYEGEYKDGEFNGHGKYTYADGTVQEGQWENGKFIG